MRRSLKLIVALAVVAIAAAGAVRLAHRPAAPDVNFVTLAGGTLSTAELRGKVVLVNFWSTTCVPCLRKMPKLVEAHGRYAARGYETVAVAMSHDSPNAVAAYAQQRSLPFTVALDPDGEVAKRFGEVRVTPTSVVLDRQGRIVKRYFGEPDWSGFQALIERALGEPA